MDSKSLHYEIGKIRKIVDDGKFYQVYSDEHSLIFLDKKHGVVPKVGNTIEIYGDVGRNIQGICINGKTAYFNGEIGLKIDFKRRLRNSNDKKRRDFKKNMATLDEQYNSLPDVFKKRLDILRRNNPKFRWEFEPYEMMVCIDAVKIANVCSSIEKIKEFSDAGYKKQMKMVKDLDQGHSGNSFGMAVRLAYHYVSNQDNVWREHGAMCPLTGCKEYGCNTISHIDNENYAIIK